MEGKIITMNTMITLMIIMMLIALAIMMITLMSFGALSINVFINSMKRNFIGWVCVCV